MVRASQIIFQVPKHPFYFPFYFLLPSTFKLKQLKEFLLRLAARRLKRSLEASLPLSVRVVGGVLWEEVLEHVNLESVDVLLGTLGVEVVLWGLLSLDSERKVVGLGRPKLLKERVHVTVLVHGANHGELLR